ncbi:MAG: DUF5017 domain-containing protein, partial [Mangrovibacterium sp.]|nr:DUF5017 domain-containing protein [Mangrovibacterium sp.]
MERLIIIIIMFLFTGLFLSSCENSMEMPEFDVWTDSDTYAAGEEITFHFSGNPQHIVFWSGEQGHVYANRDRISEQGVVQTVEFTSLAGAGTQNDNLSVLVSTDFNGTYDTANLAKATWTDITDRAVLSSTATSKAGKNTSSGAINISDFGSAEDKPVYFAFRYTSVSDTRQPRQWTISTFKIINELADGTVNTVISGLSDGGFKGINVQDETCQWTLDPDHLNPSSMTFIPGGIGSPANEDWVVSVPIKLNTVSLVDYGESVISISTLAA